MASHFTLAAWVASQPLTVVARAGSPAHWMFALLEKDAGGSVTHVPHKGGAAPRS